MPTRSLAVLYDQAQQTSPSKFLLAGSGAALVIFRLLDLLPDHPQRLFQETGGLFAVRPFESHGVNLDFAGGPDDDFDGSVHITPP